MIHENDVTYEQNSFLCIDNLGGIYGGVFLHFCSLKLFNIFIKKL